MKYELNDKRLTNKYIHLTNNAIQKNCESYGTFESGNQLSFKHFEVNFTIHCHQGDRLKKKIGLGGLKKKIGLG